MTDLTEKKLLSEKIYDGSFIHVMRDTVSLPNGKTATREYLLHPGASAVVPLTAEGDVLLVRQYRYPMGRALLEVPAGKLDPGEAPENCAVRELSEETGASAARWTKLGAFISSPAMIDEVIHLFLAEELSFGQAHTDEDEFLDPVRMPLSEAVRLVLSGEIADGKTQVALLKAWALRQA